MTTNSCRYRLSGHTTGWWSSCCFWSSRVMMMQANTSRRGHIIARRRRGRSHCKHRIWIDRLSNTRVRLATVSLWSFVAGTPVLLVQVSWTAYFFIVELILERVVDDKCRFIDIQVRCCRFWWSSLTDCIVDKGLVALGLDQIDMLLWESVYIGKVVICRLVTRLAHLLSCNSTWVLLGATCRFALCNITCGFMDSLYIASMFSFIWLARTFLIRNKFLVLIQESLFKLIISLWVLSIWYTSLLCLVVESTGVYLVVCILQVGMGWTVVGTHESAFDCVLAWGDKFILLIDSAV